MSWIATCVAPVALALSLIMSAQSRADDRLPVPPLSGRLVDQTGTLTAAQSQALTAKLALIEDTHGAQVVILIVPTTAPEDIATYGQRIADTWKVGRREVGDGVVIIVAKDDRRVNIQVAKALEGAIPDVLAARIINEQIKPAFKEYDYAGGLDRAIDRLDQRISAEALPGPLRALSDEIGNFVSDHRLELLCFIPIALFGVAAVVLSLVGRTAAAPWYALAFGSVVWVLLPNVWSFALLVVVIWLLLFAAIHLHDRGLGAFDVGAGSSVGGNAGSGSGSGSSGSGGSSSGSFNSGGGGASGSW